MKNKKISKSITKRPDLKSIRISAESSDDKPSWRFSTVDRAGPFPWPNDDEIKVRIIDKLHHFDSMRWSEIEGPDHHAIDVEKLSTTAKDRLKAINQDDIDEVFSFHLGGKPRIICIRTRQIAKLLWYDPEHEVCPSRK